MAPNGRLRDTSPTRQRILEAAAEILRETSKGDVRVSTISERAGVGVPTVYYYFNSLSELAAYAQIENYLALGEPMEGYVAQIARALESRDEGGFWAALAGDVAAAWRAGDFDGGIGAIRILTDVWSDTGAREELTAWASGKLAGWTAIGEAAQAAGWIPSDRDVPACAAILWAACLASSLMKPSVGDPIEPERIGAAAVSLLTGKPYLGEVARAPERDSKDDGQVAEA